MAKNAKQPFVARQLSEMAKLFAQRNRVYGSNYRSFGRIMLALHPEGIHVSSERDLARLGVYIQVVNKLSRYSNSFSGGGHADSLDDLSVYSQMLRELDRDVPKQSKPKRKARSKSRGLQW